MARRLASLEAKVEGACARSATKGSGCLRPTSSPPVLSSLHPSIRRPLRPRDGFYRAGKVRTAVSATLDGGAGVVQGAAAAAAAPSPSKGAYVADMQRGQQVSGYYAVASKKKEPARYNKKKGMYFFFEISDKTGAIEVKYWGGEDDAETLRAYASFGAGDVVSIKDGIVKAYNERLEIHLSPGQGDMPVDRTGEYDAAELVQPGERNIGEMICRLREVVQSVSDPRVRAVLDAVFDEDMIAEFSKAPASVRYHHGYAGGLLEHSLSMAAIARAVAEQHKPALDGDLLVAGCLLHDIGKILGYSQGTIIRRTDGEIMFGHIYAGARIVGDAAAKAGIQGAVIDKLVHMVLSHHGELGKGSPVEPLFPEAVALHKIDDCDAQVKHALLEKKGAKESAAAAGSGAGDGSGGGGSPAIVRGGGGRGYVYIG